MFYIAIVEDGVLYLYPKRLGAWVTSKYQARAYVSLRSAQALADETIQGGIEGVFIIAGDPERYVHEKV